MAIVTQKPLGRVISLLSKDKIISVRERKYCKIKTPQYRLEFKVVNSFEENIKHIPICLKVDKTTKEKENIDIQISNVATKFDCLKLSVSYKKKQEIIINPFITSIKLSSKMVGSETITNCSPINFIVDDIRSFGTNSNNNGGNVEKIELTMQQQSFYEINIKYTNGDVIECKNLPLGLIFEKGKIKGSPIYSGVYIVEAILNNEEVNNIIINVSQLPRIL